MTVHDMLRARADDLSRIAVAGSAVRDLVGTGRLRHLLSREFLDEEPIAAALLEVLFAARQVCDPHDPDPAEALEHLRQKFAAWEALS